MPATQPLARRGASVTWREQLSATSPALAHALEALPNRLSRRHEFHKWREQLKIESPAFAAALGALLLGVAGYAVHQYNTFEAERTATARVRAEGAKTKQETADVKREPADKATPL